MNVLKHVFPSVHSGYKDHIIIRDDDNEISDTIEERETVLGLLTSLRYL